MNKKEHMYDYHMYNTCDINLTSAVNTLVTWAGIPVKFHMCIASSGLYDMTLIDTHDRQQHTFLYDAFGQISPKGDFLLSKRLVVPLHLAADLQIRG